MVPALGYEGAVMRVPDPWQTDPPLTRGERSFVAAYVTAWLFAIMIGVRIWLS